MKVRTYVLACLPLLICRIACADPPAPAVPRTYPPLLLPLGKQPSLLSSSTTSLFINVAKPTKDDAKALLDSSISIVVKNASFLSLINSVLEASGKNCTVECRRVKSVKLSTDLTNVKVAGVLDSLAKAGGARLYVFPSKLLISPPELLSEQEKKDASLYGVAVSKDNVTQTGTDGKFNSILDAANTKVSVNINGKDLLTTLRSVYTSNPKLFTSEYRSPQLSGILSSVQPQFTLSLQDVKFVDALSIIAHSTGTEVFILPDKFLICVPDALTPDQKKVAISAFTPGSTNIDFNDPSSSDS